MSHDDDGNPSRSWLRETAEHYLSGPLAYFGLSHWVVPLVYSFEKTKWERSRNSVFSVGSHDFGSRG